VLGAVVEPVGGAVEGVEVPVVPFPGVAFGTAPGVGPGVAPGCEQGAVELVAHGGCVPAALLLLEPAPPGVAVVPGVLSLTVPGEVGGGVVGVAVDGVD
jgi:hypothetical protein